MIEPGPERDTIVGRPADPERVALVRLGHARGAAGAIAAACPASAATGAAALLDGGNCIDAALAAALTECVVLAPKCGLAGDVVALYRAPGSPAPTALLAIGRAGAGLADAVSTAAHLPATGGLSVGVPGAPAGYAALARFGRFDLSRLVRPAVDRARLGFVWSGQCATLAAEADHLLTRYQPGGCRYRPLGGPLPAGARVRLPGLAGVLEAFGRDGAAVFDGPLGDALVAKVADCGGVLTRADLTGVRAEWADPVAQQLGETTVWSTPGPTYGPALLGSLRVHDRGGPSLPEIVHDQLVGQAATAGDGVPYRIEGTSVVAATDADGGAVVVVHSNSFPQFGSGLVVDGLDLILSNRAGRGFSARPDRPNFPDVTRRPLTTLHCWALLGRGRMLLGGTPGGVHQVGWNAQVLARILGGEDPGEAIAAPLWRLEDGETVAEADCGLVADRTVDPLSMRSSQVVVGPPGSDGISSAWADPRSDAVAVAL